MVGCIIFPDIALNRGYAIWISSQGFMTVLLCHKYNRIPRVRGVMGNKLDNHNMMGMQ
ncbi:hypothetical protein SERLADRAFT_400899 [Serpula lacrymans var. lacrymans S7.9]|nr:uncharacterized protein SERLADRAFT_400899 [Serpula lacrymans var. lacrymans S7.9]EGO19785.1 hypothetical protein SERLADRAFT_400899 [Serpula lacrymans var. lacrymans S7.9]